MSDEYRPINTDHRKGSSQVIDLLGAAPKDHDIPLS